MPQCVIFNVKIHVEVPFFLLIFSATFTGLITANLVIYRFCYVTLGYNKSECALLGSQNADNNTAHLETLVQPYASVYNMVSSLPVMLISAVMCFFVGPWSDKFGRRPILIMPVLGAVLGNVLMVIFAALDHTSPWFFLLAGLPLLLSGGGLAYFTVLLSYLTDVTNEKNRGVRMGVFEGVMSLGMFLGNISSSFILEATNYPTVYLLGAGCSMLALIFTVFYMPESLTNPETEGRLKGLLRLRNVKEMFVTAFKKRGSSGRFIVLCCILITAISSIVGSGDGAVGFLFLREKFHWSLQHFTLFSGVKTIAGICGAILGICILHKLFKIPETVMLIIGFVSTIIGALIMGFAKYDWEVYTATSVGSMGGVVSAMLKSLISKIIPHEELGKVFPLILIGEATLGMCGNPLYTAIYNSTISINAAIFNFVSAGISVFNILLVVVVILARRVRTPEVPYDQIINDDAEHTHTCTDDEVSE